MKHKNNLQQLIKNSNFLLQRGIKTVLVLLFLGLSSNSYAWWFFIFPLPSGGNSDPNVICIGTALGVGGFVKHPNGGTYRVVELLGADSSTCNNVSYPMKAKVEFLSSDTPVNKVSGLSEVPVVHATTQARLEVGDDWKQKELIPALKADKAVVSSLVNKNLDIGIVISSFDKTEINNIQAFVKTKTLELTNNSSWNDMQASEINQMKINGVDAYQVSFIGTHKSSGKRFKFIRTYFNGASEIVALHVYSNDYKIDANIDELNRIINSVSGLSAQTIVMDKSASSKNLNKSSVSQDAELRLKKLKKMSEDGLITQKEYELKKKEILSNF